MLKDEDAVGLQKLMLEYQGRYGGQLLQGVRRVGEDKVELLMAFLHEAEDIATDKNTVSDAKLLHTVTDEAGVVTVGLHTHYGPAAPRQHLKRYAARAGEKVKCRRAFKVNVTFENIEDVLFCEICCRPCLERARNVEMAAFILSCYYTHLSNL